MFSDDTGGTQRIRSPYYSERSAEREIFHSVKIAVGKYQSDRLSLEIRRLWERLDHLETEDLYEVLADCRALMKQVIEITGNGCLAAWTASDFKTEILEDEK